MLSEYEPLIVHFGVFKIKRKRGKNKGIRNGSGRIYVRGKRRRRTKTQ
jgi:hypothetical protein